MFELNVILKKIRERWNVIKPNDIVAVNTKDGNQVYGEIKEYTEDRIVLKTVEYKTFDAREVKLEKIN